VNSLPKTVIRQQRGCDLNPGPAPESSTLTTRLPSRSSHSLVVFSHCIALQIRFSRTVVNSEAVIFFGDRARRYVWSSYCVCDFVSDNPSLLPPPLSLSLSLALSRVDNPSSAYVNSLAWCDCQRRLKFARAVVCM